MLQRRPRPMSSFVRRTRSSTVVAEKECSKHSPISGARAGQRCLAQRATADFVVRFAEERMDEDLIQMTREQLIDEVKSLRQGVRQHRDSSLHDLCWHHPSLWGLLPEKT